jgi:twitching motility protein PilT
MERLKKILRLTLGEQAHRIKMQAGKPLEILTARGPQAVPAEGPIEAAYLQKLYEFLLPGAKDALAGGANAQGTLTIPGVGALKLIAQPGAAPSLRIYLPAAPANLFDSDWARLGGKAPAAPAAPGGGPQQTVALPSGADPMSLFAPAVAGRVSPARAQMPAPPPAGGYIPEGLASPVDAVSAPSEVFAPAPAPMPMAQVAQLPRPAAPAPFPEAPAAFPPPPAPFPVAPAAFPTPPAASAEPPPILFGPEGSGDSDVSDGQNPVDPILVDLIKRKGSDLHMTCGEPLCFRIDGEIQRISQEPTSPEQVERCLAPIMPARNRTEFAAINDTDFAYEIRNVGRFRVNVFRDKNGVGTVMRHIPSKILTAEQLNLPPAITKFCHLTKGLVLVTGPTGSGKSTTLAAMIDLINKTRSDHILTVEDPIEFVHPQHKCLVNQREVHKHTGSFARALKAALREDPDIVLIGEMRDLETVAIAIETAETGHLVFGTLHTNTAVSTIDRIVDQFPTDEQEQIRMMLSASLKGVVAQTLLKKKGGGRVAAHEILVTNDAVSAMIREGKNHMIPNHMQSQKTDGNVLLNESLVRLVKEGVVDPEDAMRKAVDKGSLVEIYKRNGVKTAADAAPAAAGKAVGKASA